MSDPTDSKSLPQGPPVERHKPRPLACHIEPMLGIDDLAAVLNCSRRLIERMRSAGRVPQPDLHVGRMPRWRPATIRRWIEEGGNGR